MRRALRNRQIRQLQLPRFIHTEQESQDEVLKSGFSLQKLVSTTGQPSPALKLEGAGFTVYRISKLSKVNEFKQNSDGSYDTASILSAYRKDNYDNATLKYDFRAEGQAIANMFESSTDTVNAYNATLTADGDYANGKGNGWMPTDQPAEYRLGEMFTNDEGIFRVEGLPYGQYLVVETTIPKDVFQCDPFIVTVDSSSPQSRFSVPAGSVTTASNNYMTYNVLDEELEGYLQLIKTDTETGKAVKIANTAFALYRLDEKDRKTRISMIDPASGSATKKTDVFYTDADGLMKTPEKLPLGRYLMEKSTLSIKETLSITFRTLKILFHAAPGGIAFLGILSTIAGVCPFLTLILSRAFLDSLARACGQQAFEMEIIWLLFFLFLTNMMLSVVNNLSILLKSDVSGRISLLVNAQVLEKCVHLPMSQYDNETTYNRIRFTSEQTSIRCTNLINTFFSIVQCLISFASVVCVLVSFNGIIVIASVVASIPLFFVNKYVSSFWYKISVGRVEKQRYSDVLRDLMLRNDNIKELKLFGSLSYLKSRILNQQTDFFREDQMNRKKFCKIDTAQKAANDFVILLLKLWIIILGIKQRATLGTINLYTSSLDQIQSAIFSFCTQLNTFYEQALYLESLFDLFDMQTEDENCGTPLTEPIRTIEFRHVYFSYPATNVYALKNVSFVLDDRHTYALIGLNGSGKTTLLKLLMKLYKPTLGTILINGQDIEEIDTAGLRKRISAIFQDFIKYPFTAEENITISDLENANDLHRLSKVIDDAGAAEVIDGLPHRLQTQLQKGWNGGTELSQGQWQKIAIARCLFKQSDVYLFDEPFSALDAISEQHIIKRLNLKTKMSITIFITHRYSSLRLADFILVLKDGELVESGSHQELQKAGKYYSELIKAQIEPIDHLAQLDET